MCGGVDSQSSPRVGPLNSSTRFDFVDSFLSVSPVVLTDSSKMGESDVETLGGVKCKCSDGNSCEVCAASGDRRPSESLYDMLNSALGKVDKLVDEVRSMKLIVQSNQNRLNEIEGSIAGSVADDSDSSKAADASVRKKVRVEKARAKKSKCKPSVEEEKQRQLKVLSDRLKGEDVSSGSEGSSESAEDVANLRDLKKKLTKRQRKKCEDKLAARLKDAGAKFPEEESSSSSSISSGTDSDSSRSRSSRRRRNRRKVKSGAKIKKRPVVRTELWPHTIANEEDIEEVTSETIGLPKFLSCFSFIMLSCGKTEAAGRASLLHALSMVFECLPWSEVRSFHNLVMVKLEQDRIDWGSNFAVLANQYLEKKVRQNLKSRGSATSSYSNSKSSGKKFSGKGYSSARFRPSSSSAGKGKSLYSFLCRQWNEGECSYGDKCKFWHVCWSCAEAGKLGELHKASSGDCTSKRKPRV